MNLTKKLLKNKLGESFGFGLVLVILSIGIFSLAFISENNKITGFVAYAPENTYATPANLIEFNDVNSLATLSAGNYYVDGNGVVYWMDDESKPAIAKVNFIDESQRNKHIYIETQGRVGYVLDSILIDKNAGELKIQ
ncbi:hypothetical protein HYX00_01635 [Candidatus Woesearchaeota archaeon]|nr:hypothetical protein [Candidatus Woesearchaeota archaeon]